MLNTRILFSGVFVVALLALLLTSSVEAQTANGVSTDQQSPTGATPNTNAKTPTTLTPAQQVAPDNDSEKALAKKKYKKRLTIALIVGSIGAIWFTLGQGYLGESSPSSCVQNLIIVGLILYGMITSVYCVIKLMAD